jgi:dTDP-4-dehydrorhamnose reductase
MRPPATAVDKAEGDEDMVCTINAQAPAVLARKLPRWRCTSAPTSFDGSGQRV